MARSPRPDARAASTHPEALTVTLSSGVSASMERDGDAWNLVVDGTPQSNVVPEDPRDLRFAYIRHMGRVIEHAWPGTQPLTALHLGAGAMSIPRFVEELHPGSRQQVIELETELVGLVRKVAPLPRHASLRVRYGDAREQLSRLPAGLHGAVDLLVVDIFAGAQTPAHVTSVEFFAELVPFLAPHALVLVNIADGHELRFARGELATLMAVFAEVSVITDPAVAKGRRFGNLMAIARPRSDSGAPLAERLDGIHRALAPEFPPATLLDHRTVEHLAAGRAPVRDDDAVPSPRPGRGIFTARRSGGWN